MLQGMLTCMPDSDHHPHMKEHDYTSFNEAETKAETKTGQAPNSYTSQHILRSCKSATCVSVSVTAT